LEEDLRLSSKYLVDQDVNPCGWRELDVEEIESKEDSLSRPGHLEDIGKPMTRYQVRAPHVEAVRFLLKNGWELTVDNKVGYITKKGKGRLYERAVPYQFLI